MKSRELRLNPQVHISNLKNFLLTRNFSDFLITKILSGQKSSLLDHCAPLEKKQCPPMTLIMITIEMSNAIHPHWPDFPLKKHKVLKSLIVLPKTDMTILQNKMSEKQQNMFFYLLTHEQEWFKVLTMNHESQVILNKVEFDSNGRDKETFDLQAYILKVGWFTVFHKRKMFTLHGLLWWCI